MFARWGYFVVRARWLVLAAGLGLVVVGVTWGTGVFGSLSAGGFTDQHTMSAQVRSRITQELGTQDSDIVALYSSPDRTVDDLSDQYCLGAVVYALMTGRPPCEGESPACELRGNNWIPVPGTRHERQLA